MKIMRDMSRKQGASSPCAACKLLRRRCAQDCVFAPYFPADEPQKFANVHKVFGASNVSKMLQVQLSILPTYTPNCGCIPNLKLNLGSHVKNIPYLQIIKRMNNVSSMS